jgi:hypothetical protein
MEVVVGTVMEVGEAVGTVREVDEVVGTVREVEEAVGTVREVEEAVGTEGEVGGELITGLLLGEGGSVTKGIAVQVLSLAWGEKVAAMGERGKSTRACTCWMARPEHRLLATGDCVSSAALGSTSDIMASWVWALGMGMGPTSLQG